MVAETLYAPIYFALLFQTNDAYRHSMNDTLTAVLAGFAAHPKR
jgi:hypothetical protein